MMLRLAMILMLALGAACAKKSDAPARDALNRTLLDTVTKPLLLAEIATKKASFTLSQRAQNGPVITWGSQDGVSLAFEGGVLVATRGLGDDLMSSDITNTLRMLSGQMGNEFYTRFQTFLDGEYQSRFRSFQCRRTESEHEVIQIFEKNHATTRIEETCYSPGFEITNIYWRGSDGLVWKSKQWVSPSIKYLAAERLVR